MTWRSLRTKVGYDFVGNIGSLVLGLNEVIYFLLSAKCSLNIY